MKEVCLLGFAKSTQHYAWELPETVPIWSLNNAFMKGFPRLDVVFDPHPIEHIAHPVYIKGRPDHDRIEWLRTNTEIPVYMQKAYPEVPMAVRYPIEDVIRMVGPEGANELTSNFSLMMAFALLNDYKRIHVAGFNMSRKNNSDYIHQIPGGKYMIGFARGRGVEVIGPDDSSLFQKNKIYGYQGTSMITRRTLEMHLAGYDKQLKQHDADFISWKAILDDRSKGFVKNGKIMGNHKPIHEASANLQTADRQRFAAYCCKQALQKLIDEADLIEVEPVEIDVKKIMNLNT